MTAQEIKAARADLGTVLGIKMTQKDMAKMLCVSKRTYEYWESKSESSVPIPEWVPEMLRLKKMEFKLPKVVSDRQMKELRNRPESITGWNNRAEHPELITLREQVKVLREALGLAKAFIKNGLDLGYITPPEPGDAAYDTLPTICDALSQAKPKEVE